MKKLLTLAALALTAACAQTATTPQDGHVGGMSCKCCQEMMKEGCKCCQGMGGDTTKEGAGCCCCKGTMSGMDMKDGKGMMCQKPPQDKAQTKMRPVKASPVPASGHEQHH